MYNYKEITAPLPPPQKKKERKKVNCSNTVNASYLGLFFGIKILMLSMSLAYEDGLVDRPH